MVRDLGLLTEKHHVFGCDVSEPARIPESVMFECVDLEDGHLPYENNQFDLVIFSHVIEHVRNPVELLGEILRVLRPDGVLYIECPSERSTWMTPWAPAHWNLILSFYDDPTHIGRPWSPQSLRRMALYYGCEPLLTVYDASLLRLLRLPFDWLYGVLWRKPDHLVESWWLAVGWASIAVIRKPEEMDAGRSFDYYSFKGKRIGPEFKL